MQGGVSDSESWGQKLAELSRHVSTLAEQVRGSGRPQFRGGLRIQWPHRMDVGGEAANAHLGTSVLPLSLHPPTLQAWK